MKVQLIRHTTDAFDLLIGTKTTRMRGKDPEEMSEEEKQEHWAYMLDTIKSPFDFVDYIFDIEGVSKNFTHQLVRTRTGAYQQETSRALEMDVYNSTVMPDAFAPVGGGGALGPLGELWHDAMADADAHYKGLLAAGAELQDARAVCPSNMATNIKAKFNLRTLSEMAKNRLCTRTAGEYQTVFREMRRLVLEVHPWAESLLQVACVSTGQCAFPRHGKLHCQFWRPWMDLKSERESLKNVFWSTGPITNNPIAKNGVSNG